MDIKLLSNAIRFLIVDAIQRANSGHPGAALGMSDIATVLWNQYLNHNPNNPNWFNRDRFVLSNGHASMLLYSLLHLTGYNLSIEDIKRFRQLNSKTPGHPEYKCTPGVETTTGPLGQGLANAVGFAIAEKILSAQFNRLNYNIIDHYTYVFVGDGCMMEGISHEVCSLAGTLKLGKLIVFYDKNGISIDGNIKNWFSENTAQRFLSYGWHVIDEIDGYDVKKISSAIECAKGVSNKPSLIICKTIIGYGSPNKSGCSTIHGAPLGSDEISQMRLFMNWPYKAFFIPDKIYKFWNASIIGEKKERLWKDKFKMYKKSFPKLAKELIRRIESKLPKKLDLVFSDLMLRFKYEKNNISTRQASQCILEVLCKELPELIGGSSDLSPSNLTITSHSISVNSVSFGNYIHYGVREFGMSAIMNGLSLHGGFIPYGATFLVFLEYSCNAVRMAALMGSKGIFIYTHDSIGVGEDGPTHQPVEQLSILRSMPKMTMWRPCDQLESVVSWKYALKNNKGPTSLIFSRQILKKQNYNLKNIKNIFRGGYILKENSSIPDIILISTGSEVELAVNVYKILVDEGKKIRVVSIPSTDVFENQNSDYRELVLPSCIEKRVVIESSISHYWNKYVGKNGLIIGMNSFGKSAPKDVLLNEFGFTVEKIINKIRFLFEK